MTTRPHCCDALKTHVEHRCPVHPNPLDCPDNVVIYVPRFDEFGLPVRDGENASAHSYITITRCPWYGAKLPESTRNRYFEEIEKRGADLGEG